MNSSDQAIIGPDEPRWLVFVSAGDAYDLDPSLRSCAEFDLLVAFYGEEEAVRYQFLDRGADVRMCKGGKYQNLWRLFREDPHLLSRYEAVLMLDDDLRLTKTQITHMFEVRSEYGLAILGPTYRRTGKISWGVNRTRWRSSMRYTNVVENGAALFETQALVLFLEEFDGSLTGYGIENWYTQVIGSAGHAKFAILDEVAVVNPWVRAGNGRREIDHLQKPDESRASWQMASDRYQIPFLHAASWDPAPRRAVAAATAVLQELTDAVTVTTRKVINRLTRWRKELRLAVQLRRMSRDADPKVWPPAHLPDVLAAWPDDDRGESSSVLELLSDLSRRSTGPMMECGTGLSTICMALASADRPGISVVAVEHSPGWARVMRRRLRIGGIKNVELLERPLLRSQEFDWYEIEHGDVRDDLRLVVFNSPTASLRGGRRGAFENLRPLLPQSVGVVFNGLNLPDESGILEDWVRSASSADSEWTVSSHGEKRVAVFSP